MKIQGILSFCEQKIEHIHSPQLRASELVSLLKAERENIKNPNLHNRNFTAAELTTDIDTNEVRYELNYAIILLTDYPLTQSFSIAQPSNAYTKEFAGKLNSIKDSVEIIVNKYQPGNSL